MPTRHQFLRSSAFGLQISALALVTGCVTHSSEPSFPDASALSRHPGLPDPLVMLDGRRVTSRAHWFNERRPELQALFEHYMYGAIPPKPAHTDVRLIGEHHDFLGGKATLKLLSLETGPTNAPRIDLLLVVPNERRSPAPVFLAMNFCGNHALTDDPRVPLAHSWLRSNCKGCKDHFPTEAARGGQAEDWPLAEIVRRRYGLATFCHADIDPDRADRSDGIYAWLADRDAARNNPANRGTIAAWAWGFHRCVDYLVTDRDVDPRRIAAVGHSRNGKTALLAAAYDERIAIAFPHQAGCGGSSPSRGKTGESLKAINDHFPHWFNAQFKQFNDAPERLPFDQNCLVALCAPRPVLFSAAQEDQWSNPAGQLQVLQAADPVYRLLGVEGLGYPSTSPSLHHSTTPSPGTPAIPPLRQLVGHRLGYYIREGKHSMTPDDWKVFMDFADRQWRSQER
jgi:hypothetical protein